MTAATGLISPPMDGLNYSHNALCLWSFTRGQQQQQQQFRTPQRTTVFKAERVLLERGNDRGCPFDFVRFFAGSTDGEVLKTVCGRSTSPVVMASPVADSHVAFKSDRSISDLGFNFTYSYSDCGGVISGPGPVTVASPTSSSSNNYGNNVDCAWMLSFEEGSQIKLNLNRFALESSSDCSKDYFSVHNGGFSSSPVIWKGCGSTMPSTNPIVSMSNRMWIQFHSDGSGVARGFSFTAEQENVGCGGVLHGMGGNISSPTGGSGGKYPNSVECVWDFHAGSGYHAVLQFRDRFDVETVSGCSNDYLELRDYRRSVGRFVRIGERICGREVPPDPLVSGSERSKLVFRSNGQVNGDGFKISWKMECGAVYNDSSVDSGEFSSPGYPEPYSNQMSCNYTIVAPSPQDFVALTFLEPFDLERSATCYWDWVKVTEMETGVEKGKFCGSELPPAVATRGSMKVSFRTDYSVVGRGFKAR